MKFNGKDEALKLIKALNPNEANKIISTIAKSDPQMAQYLESNLVQLEDIEYLTQAMLMNVLRDIDLEIFGLAIRDLDSKIIDKILSQVSMGIKLDIEDGLKSGPCSLDKIQKAQSKLLELLSLKVNDGQVVIDKSEKLV